MLGLMRNSPAVRWFLCLAALLSLSAAFGLHPEPDGSSGPFAGAGLSTARLQAPAHGCIACLAHGPALASASAGLQAPGTPCAGSVFSVHAGWEGRLPGRRQTGRSPPARS
jgi:hypothetical protein